ARHQRDRNGGVSVKWPAVSGRAGPDTEPPQRLRPGPRQWRHRSCATTIYSYQRERAGEQAGCLPWEKVREWVEQALILELEDWLDTPQGRYVAAWENAQISGMVANAFGYHAIQIGLPHWDLLQANRIPHQVCTSIEPASGTCRALVVAEPE